MSLTKRINRLAKNIVVIEDNGTGSGDAFSEFSGLKVAQLRTRSAARYSWIPENEEG